MKNERVKLVAANWKMNLTLEEAAEWLAKAAPQLDEVACDVMVFPSLVMITDLMDMYEGETLLFGAQNCSHKAKGAYTGEVSAAQLASVGIDAVLIGHSERREYFNETNAQIREKLQQALEHELLPVFCFGEPLAVREKGEQLSYVKKQLEESLFAFTAEEVSNVILAYEPVWAIGTGINATPEQAQEMHAYVRQCIQQQYGRVLAEEIRIIYGGSCKPDNAASIFACPDVDGGLIGGASLNAEDFIAIAQLANQ